MSKLLKLSLVLCYFALPFCVQGQSSMSTTYPKNIFAEAFQFFEQKQYQVAQNHFETYLQTSSSISTEKGIQAQYYICLASLHLQQPNFENRLKKFVHKYPNHPKAIDIEYHIGSLYFKKGQQRAYRTAYAHLIKVASKNPRTKQEFEANYKLAYSYMSTKRFSDAELYFKTLIGSNRPNLYSQKASYYLGVIYLYERLNYSEATKHFRNALSEEYLKESAYTLLAKSYFLAGDYQNGKKYWQIAENAHLTKDKDLARIASESAFKLKKYDDVISFLKNAETDFGTQVILATSYLNLKNSDKAIESFQNLSPSDNLSKQLIKYNLGMAYLDIQDYDQASSYFKEASQIFEDEQIRHKSALYWAKSAFEARNYSQAIHAATNYQTYYNGGRHSAEMKEILLESHISSGNYPEALAYIKQIKNPSKKLQLTYQALAHQQAELLYSKKKYQEAITAFEASLKFKNRDKELDYRAYFIMGTIAFKRQMYNQANSYYNRIPKKSDLFIETFYYKGYMARYQENNDAALHYFFSYVSNRNKQKNEIYRLDALVRLADAYAISGKYPLAHGTYQQALEKGYRKADYIFYNKGEIFLEQGKRELALRQFDHIIYKYPQSVHLYEAFYSKSLILSDQLKRKEALVVMNTLLAKNPPFETKIKAYFQRAILHSGLNQDQLAIADYKAVLKLSSTDSLSQKAIFSLNEYKNSGQPVDNLAILNQRFEQMNPNNETSIQIYFKKAKVFARSSNDIAEIKDRLKPFLKEDSPFSNEANYVMGLAYEKQNDKSGMLKYYEKTQGEWREKVLLKVAKIELERKNFNSSAEYYAEARHLFKEEHLQNEALQGLVLAYEGMGEWDGLEQINNELARKTSHDMFAFVTLYKGKILMRKKEYLGAIKELEKAQLKNKSQDNAKIILLLGQALSLSGKYQKSNTVLSAIKKNYNDYKWSIERAEKIMNANNQSLNKK